MAQEKKQEEKQVSFSTQDVDECERKRKEFLARIDRMERGAAISGDQEALAELKAFRGEVKTTPAPAFKKRGFLKYIWDVLSGIIKWALDVCTGALLWVVEVAKSALRFAERCLHDLGEVFA